MAVTLTEFSALCRSLEATRSRLEKLERTAGFFRSLTPDEASWTVAFLTGRPFPASDPRVLDVSWGTLSAWLGTVGPPAAEAGLTVDEVARAFEAIAAARGPGSRRRKADILGQLFERATADEREIITRIVHGEMRLGLHEGLVPDAVAAAAGVPSALVRRALSFVSDPSVVARLALREGEAGLHAIDVRLFVPLLPMLADPAPDVDAVLRAHGEGSALEWKYDGARIQLHKTGDAVRLWSRRLTEVTASLPEIVAIARADLAATSCILDGEVVARGPDGRPLPFQELMRRFRRVHGIDASARDVPLDLYLFDCLLVDGRSLVDQPYRARWAALAGVTGGRFLARRALAADSETVRAFLGEALAAGHEGLVAKALDSPYTPGTRGKRWLKLKPAETIDCVIVAADRGAGRRRGWLSNYHLAVRDEGGGFAPIGKTFKGLTDREFEAMTGRLQELGTADDGYTVTVRPEVVVEVAYNEIQWSPQYASGLALRFARITRIREDKTPGDATTLGTLRALFERQFAAKSRGGRRPAPADPA